MSYKDICITRWEHQLKIAKEDRKIRGGASMDPGSEINMHVDLQACCDGFTDVALSFLTANAKRETWQILFSVTEKTCRRNENY